MIVRFFKFIALLWHADEHGWPEDKAERGKNMTQETEHNGVVAVEAAETRLQCSRCAGNGEIVTDWHRYLHPEQNDVGDEAVADCPDCDGYGFQSYYEGASQ